MPTPTAEDVESLKAEFGLDSGNSNQPQTNAPPSEPTPQALPLSPRVKTQSVAPAANSAPSEAQTPTTPTPQDVESLKSEFGLGSSKPDPNAIDTSGMDAQFATGQTRPEVPPEKLPGNLQFGSGSILPRSTDALSWLNGKGAADTKAQADYNAKNQSPGIPLDTETGADALTRLKVGVHRNRLDQLDVLRKEYGDENVRLDDKGDFIVRTTDEQTGKLKDLKVDERNITLRDFLDVAHEYPAFALSMLTTKGVPVKAVLEGALKGAAGYFAGGSAEDLLASEINNGQSSSRGPDFGEILKYRGEEAGFNALGGYAFGKALSGLGSISQAAQMINSKLSDTSGTMAEVAGANKAVKEFSGVDIPRTLSEQTGNPMALRMQTFLQNIPFARGIILKQLAKQSAAEREVQSVFFGGQTPDPEAAGRQVIDLLSGEMKGAESKAVNASKLVRQQGTEALQAPLESISGNKLSSSQFGKRMIKRSEAQLQSFKDRASEMFNAARAPDALAPTFDTTPIKEAAQSIKANELINDTAGNPILAPSGLVSKLNELSRLPEKQSYFDLVKLRSAVYDLIDSPEPISSNASRLLKKIGAAITLELDTQGKTLLSSDTLSKIKSANEFYKNNVETFYQKGIRRMLTPQTESGAIDPEAIANRLIAGGKGSVSTYETLKGFFEKPQAVQDMNRLLRDKIIESGTDQATSLVNLEQLAATVSKMEPEIVQALFGKSKSELMSIAQHSQLAMKVGNFGSRLPFIDSQTSVESDALQKLFNDGNVTPQSVRALVTRQNELKKQYGNVIRASVRQNDFGAIAASPETFVKDYLTNTAIPDSAVKDVLQSVYASGNESLIGDIRRVYLSDIFKNAAKLSKGETAQAVSQINQSPLRDIDAQKFALAFQDPAVTKRMELILGHDSFQALKDFAKSMAGRIPKDVSAMMPGALKGGSMFDKMIAGSLSTMAEVPKFMALAYLMTSPKALNAVTAAFKVNENSLPNVVRAAILSPEFMDVISKQSATPEQAKQVAQDIKKWAIETKPK